MSHASAMLPVGVRPHSAEVNAKPTTPATSTRRRPNTSASFPPNAKSADSDNRYPLITHWAPVSESDRWRSMFGMAIATIV